MPGGTPCPSDTGRTMPASPRPAGRRAVWAWVLAWSVSGLALFFAGTAGTTVDNLPNPLPPLRKSVPVGCGDKSENSGDSGDKSFRARPRAFTPWFCLVPGAPDLPLSCAKVAPAPRRPHAARQGLRRVIGQAQKGRAGCGSTGSTQGPASGVCSRRRGPCRGSGTHAPTARGKPCHGQSLGTLRP